MSRYRFRNLLKILVEGDVGKLSRIPQKVGVDHCGFFAPSVPQYLGELQRQHPSRHMVKRIGPCTVYEFAGRGGMKFEVFVPTAGQKADPHRVAHVAIQSDMPRMGQYTDGIEFV